MTARPRTVTIASLWAGLGAGLTFVSAYATLTNWGSTEVQDSLAEVADSPYLSGVTVDDLLAYGRWGLQLLIVAAIAGLVFAVFAARGHRPSQIGLTILSALAAPMFIIGGLAGFLPAVVCFLVIYLLWTPDARAFFRGEEAAATGAATGRSTPASTNSGSSTNSPTSSPTNSAPDPFAAATPPVPVQSAPEQSHPDQPYPGTAPATATAAPEARGAVRRPTSVTVALWISLAASVLGAAFCALMALVSLVAGDQLEEQLRADENLTGMIDDAGLTIDQVLLSLGVMAALGVVWGAFGAIATILAWRRMRVGRVLLIVAAALSALFGLATMPAGLPIAALAAYVVVALALRPAGDWFEHDR